MKIRAEEVQARQLEKEGYIVIRAFTRGCPDLIAFRPEAAGMIVAREVKAGTDQPRPNQREVINYLKAKGVDAHFYFTDSLNNPVAKLDGIPALAPESLQVDISVSNELTVRMTPEERIEQEKPWIEAGKNNVLYSGPDIKEFLNGVKKYTALWYRMRAGFKQGQRLAVEGEKREND